MRIRLAAVLSTAALTLSACGNGTTDAMEDPKAPLKVGVSPTPHAEILEFVQDNLADRAGLELELAEFDDYNRPNEALAHNELDANYFQHKPYLSKYRSERGGDFVWKTPVHSEPLGVYAQQVDSIDELGPGATVTLPNDPANEARALKLLEHEGLLTLKPGSGVDANVRDVVRNPKNLELEDMAADQLPRSVEDADAAVVTGNYAIKAGLTEPIAAEDTTDDPYANGLVTNQRMRDDPRVNKLAELLNSAEVAKFMQDEWGGVVTPT